MVIPLCLRQARVPEVAPNVRKVLAESWTAVVAGLVIVFSHAMLAMFVCPVNKAHRQRAGSDVGDSGTSAGGWRAEFPRGQA